MQRRLSDARRGKVDGRVFVVSDVDDRVIGWALCWSSDKINIDIPIAYFYVRASARRSGVGRRLAQAVSKFCDGEFAVWAYSDESRTFFDAVVPEATKYHS